MMGLCDFCKKARNCEVYRLKRYIDDNAPDKEWKEYYKTKKKLRNIKWIQIAEVVYNWGMALEVYGCDKYEPESE